MSEIIFADTSFLVAFYNKKDDKHSIARLLVQNFIHHQTSVAFLIIDYIFDETLTTVMRQGGKNLAVDIAQKIYESPSILHRVSMAAMSGMTAYRIPARICSSLGRRKL